MYKPNYVAWVSVMLLFGAAQNYSLVSSVAADDGLVYQTPIDADSAVPISSNPAPSVVKVEIETDSLESLAVKQSENGGFEVGQPVIENRVPDSVGLLQQEDRIQLDVAPPSYQPSPLTLIPSFPTLTKSESVKQVRHVGPLGICGPGCGAQSFAYGRICGCDARRPYIWGRAELLSYWMTGYDTPPLVTQSPAGTPQSNIGVLGQPDTSVLFGDDPIDTGARFGTRITGGMWFDCCRKLGIQGEFFGLASPSGSDQNFFSAGDPLLARPFLNTDPNVNGQDSQILAAPGLSWANINVNTSSQIYSAAPHLRWNCCCVGCSDACNCSASYTRWDTLFGYRYFHLGESFEMTELLDPQGGVFPPGTEYEFTDRITTRNNFHGIEIGGEWMRQRNRWVAELTGLLAVGQMVSRATLEGSTTVRVPTLLETTTPGGFLVPANNIGTVQDRNIAVIPQLRFKLGYHFRKCTRFHVGYDVMWISSVMRPGTFMTNEFNGQVLAQEPLPGFKQDNFGDLKSSVFLHGINLGITWNF